MMLHDAALAWLENHLIVLGVLAICSGFGLGALLTRTTASPRRD